MAWVKGSEWSYSIRYKDWERVPVEQYTEEQLEKKGFVEDVLSPTLRKSNCGWFALRYEIVLYGTGKEEIVSIWNKEEPIRTITVSGCSKACIAQEVFDNIW